MKSEWRSSCKRYCNRLGVEHTSASKNVHNVTPLREKQILRVWMYFNSKEVKQRAKIFGGETCCKECKYLNHHIIVTCNDDVIHIYKEMDK